MKPQRIAYIQLGSFSNANHYIVHELRKHFPNYEIDVIDVGAPLRAQKQIRLLNLFYTFKEYGKELLLRRRSLRECMYLTSYLFKKMSDWSRSAMDQKEYAFSIQTQSMFDASRPDVEHFVYTDHTVLAHLRYPQLQNKRAYVASKRWLTLEKALYRKAAATFTMSKFIEKSLHDDYACPQEKVVFARAGANTKVNGTVLIAKYTRKEILFVGVRWKRKGGPQLLEAFKHVLDVHPDARLTIIGSVPNIEPAIRSKCRVLGPLSTAEVTKYYERATIFCMPTTLEPFGFVFIEAMMHKLPIVATNVGAIPDFVTHGTNGFMHEPNDVRGLATSLITLLDSPAKCRAFGKAGYKIAVEKYTWDMTISTIKEKIMQITGLPPIQARTEAEMALITSRASEDSQPQEPAGQETPAAGHRSLPERDIETEALSPADEQPDHKQIQHRQPAHSKTAQQESKKEQEHSRLRSS